MSTRKSISPQRFVVALLLAVSWRVTIGFAQSPLTPATTAASADDGVAGRRITYREQSLKPYDPFAAEELFKKIAIPPAPALSPAEALKSFEIAPGFKLECVAHEPLVCDPVMFEFDPDGRMWVVEMRGWMLDVNGTGEGDPIGQVVVLEDTDGDTLYDKSTVFLDKLVMPRTVSFVQGGVLIAEPPNLWYCVDKDGDLKCDEKTLVGKYGQPGNPEHTDNGLFHAMDNWMYNAKSTVRHRFVDGKLIEEPTAFRGQWGITQDDVGRLFYNYENSSLHVDLIPHEYAKRNKHVQPPLRGRAAYTGLNVNLGADAHEVFPIRVTPGITLGGTELREDGTLKTFTIACGPTIFRGEMFPSWFRGAVIPEAGGNLVRLDLFEGDDVHLKVRNAFEGRELLASRDERFRPVCARTGPDGALYICDLYRGIIEHVIFMMPYLRKQILDRGLDTPVHMGRIYRITHENAIRYPLQKLGGLTSPQLVEQFARTNGWARDTAQRLLIERKAVDAVPQLEAYLQKPRVIGKHHALWTLDALGALTWPTLDAVLQREGGDDTLSAAIRLAERTPGAPTGAALYDCIYHFAYDTAHRQARFQTMLTLGGLRLEQADNLLADCLAREPTELYRAAIVSGCEGRESEMLHRLIKGRWTAEKEAACGAIEVLAMAVRNEGKPERVEALLDLALASSSGKPWLTEAIVAGLSVSEQARARWPTPVALSKEPPLLAKLASREATAAQAKLLRKIVTWPGDTTPRPTKPVVPPLTAVEEKRYKLGEAVYNVTCYSCHKGNGLGQLGQAPPLADSDWVNGPPDRLVRVALHGLTGPITVNDEKWDLKMPGLGGSPVLNDERLAGVLTYIRRAWGNYSAPVEAEFVAQVRAASASRSRPWTVDDLEHPEREASPSVVEADPLAPYRPLLAGGSAERGRVLFHQNREVRCNACHKVGESGGGFVGPDLTEVGKRADREHLLEALVAPSAKTAKGFETLVVVTTDGAIVSGTFVADDGKSLTIAPPTGGQATIPLGMIEERITSPVSSMPPMGKAFSPEQIADLVAYLKSLQNKN
jgi:putative heme-binding domain-containing protein